MTIDELVQSIDERLQTLQAEQTQLESARVSLVGSARASRQAARSTPQKRRSRTNGQAKLSQDDLIRLLPASGISRGMLVSQTKASQNRIASLLKTAESEGLVRREGERKLTRWFPIARGE